MIGGDLQGCRADPINTKYMTSLTFVGCHRGATQKVCNIYSTAKNDIAGTKPLSWTDLKFTLEPYDLVFLPVGHEKGATKLSILP